MITWKEAQRLCVGVRRGVRISATPCISIYSKRSCKMWHSNREVRSTIGGMEGGCVRVLDAREGDLEEA